MAVIGRTVMHNGNFFFQAKDGIRELVRSRGIGNVYMRPVLIVEIH